MRFSGCTDINGTVQNTVQPELTNWAYCI